MVERSVRSPCDRGSKATFVKVIGYVIKIYYLEVLHASEGTLSCWSRLYLQSLAPAKPHCARVVDYGPFSLWINP
jgi:hypothetical protein